MTVAGRVRVVSNFKGLEAVEAAGGRLEHTYVGDWNSTPRFVRECLRSDVVIINVDQKKLRAACLARLLVPGARFRLVAVDVVLRTPATAAERLKAAALRLLFSPEDPEALAREIRRLWDDHRARASVAARGRAYAETLGDKERLMSDVLRVSLGGLRRA